MVIGKLKRPSKDDLDEIMNNFNLKLNNYGPAGMQFDTSEKQRFVVFDTYKDGKVDIYKLRKDADPHCLIITTDKELAEFNKKKDKIVAS